MDNKDIKLITEKGKILKVSLPSRDYLEKEVHKIELTLLKIKRISIIKKLLNQ